MSALETLLAKCSTDAQRVTMLREALDLEKAEHHETADRVGHSLFQANVAKLNWQRRSVSAEKAIAKARKLMREGAALVLVYRALDWRQR